MRGSLILAVAGALICARSVLAQPPIDDEFNTDHLDWGYWCPCQINMSKSPVTFPADPGRPGNHIARIVVDDASLGGNLCRSGLPQRECQPPADGASFVAFDKDDETSLPSSPPESLGPTLIRPPGTAFFEAATKDPYCTEAVERRAVAAGEEGLCIQRQELRLQKQYTHYADDPHQYSFRFRMPDTIEDRMSSIRWVTAQWKQEPVSEAYRRQFGDNWGPSPFLAQRFDDGVLHVTVQDEHCRCMVASAPYPDGFIPVWQNGLAQYCVSVEPGNEGKACTPDLNVEYGPEPVLLSPLGRWVEMRYRVQATRSSAAVIEVYEDGRFIVRVTGRIGYEPEPGVRSVTKFKIGHYRDYMPYAHAMEIDWLKVEGVGK